MRSKSELGDESLNGSHLEARFLRLDGLGHPTVTSETPSRSNAPNTAEVAKQEKAAKQERTIVPVVPAGGSGTRLWPLSRSLLPKQFVRFSDEDTTFFSGTMKRLSADETR